MKSRALQSSPYGNVISSREIRKLAEVCVSKDGIQTGPFGSQLHSSDYVKDGTPIITVEHLGENIIEGKNPPLVHADDVKRLSKYTMQEGDIIFSRVGSVDKRALVSEKQSGWLISGRLLRVRPDTSLVDPHYLSYFFGLPMFKTYIRSIAVGATMPSLNTGLLSEVPVILPTISEQKAIGKALSMLDEKIRINKELTTTLEDIAQTIFKSWFIDFNPVKAKMAGEKPVGMDEATAAIFPDSMEESEFGLIPKGWEVRQIGEVSETLLGGTPSRKREEFWGGDIPWINSGKVNEFRITSPSEYITELGLEKSATKLLRKGTTVIAITGATLGQFSRLEIDSCANQSVVGIVCSKKASNEYIFLNIKNGIQRLISAQTGGAQQHINKEDVNAFLIVYPGERLMNIFTEIAQDMFTQIGVLLSQSNTIAAIRDSLLPRLISGELHIPEEMLAS
jgi:type I restriction enzyme S subunit